MSSYYIARAGNKTGPYEESEIRRQIEDGTLTSDDLLVRKHGGLAACRESFRTRCRQTVATTNPANSGPWIRPVSPVVPVHSCQQVDHLVDRVNEPL